MTEDISNTFIHNGIEYTNTNPTNGVKIEKCYSREEIPSNIGNYQEVLNEIWKIGYPFRYQVCLVNGLQCWVIVNQYKNFYKHEADINWLVHV